MRPVLLAREETDERPALTGNVIANGALQHGVASLERIQDGRDGHRTGDFERNFAGGPRERTKMRRKHHVDHASVCTSTESTAGRSRAIAVQLSPPSGE